MANLSDTINAGDAVGAHTPEPAAKRPAATAKRMQLARLARARGHLWTAFYNLYAAALAEGDSGAGWQLAEVLNALNPARPLAEVDEAFELALRTPWIRPSALTRATVDYLMLEPSVELAAEGIGLLAADLDAAVEHLAGNRVFAALLQICVASDLRLERLLVFLREHLLTVDPTTPGAMRLAALIATQANLVEYLWPRTVGRVDEPAHGTAHAPVTAARALMNSMFRAPGLAEIAALESLEADPAIACLLERVRDEPLSKTRHRDEIERAAVSLGTSALECRGAAWVAPRWVKEPMIARRLPLAIQRRLRSRRIERGEILVAGCGTGQELPVVRATYPSGHVTALDRSVEKLAYGAHKCAQEGVERIDFFPGSLLDVPPLGWMFDLIECASLQSQSSDPDFECEALERCTRPGALLRVAVYSDATQRLVAALRNLRATLGLAGGLAELRELRAELIAGRHGALPPALLRSPVFYTASGLRELLFGETEVAVGVTAWLAMLHRHRFDFLCEEINGEFVRTARDAGLRGAAAWSIRDCRRFDREGGLGYGGTQFLWFERRGEKRP